MYCNSNSNSNSNIVTSHANNTTASPARTTATTTSIPSSDRTAREYCAVPPYSESRHESRRVSIKQVSSLCRCRLHPVSQWGYGLRRYSQSAPRCWMMKTAHQGEAARDGQFIDGGLLRDGWMDGPNEGRHGRIKRYRQLLESEWINTASRRIGRSKYRNHLLSW